MVNVGTLPFIPPSIPDVRPLSEVYVIEWSSTMQRTNLACLFSILRPTSSFNTYRMDIINQTIPRRQGVRNQNVCLRGNFHFRERVLKEIENTMLLGV